jgi:hypothetical protein
MATLRLLFVAALVALPLWVTLSTPTAHACSPPVATGAPPRTLADDVRDADLIVTGRLGEMLVLPPESVEHPETLGHPLSRFQPIEIKVVADEYLKGSGPETPLIYRTAQFVYTESGVITSVETSQSACGEASVSGTYYVLFLKKFDSLRYAKISGSLPFADDEAGADYIAQIRGAVAAEQLGLPPTGSGPPSHNDSHVPLIAASALAALGLAANAAYALRRRR